MQKIRIDFDNPGLPQHISAVENDSQSRFFQATLYENGKAYTAPEGATYSIMYRGFGPQNQGWYDTINDGAGKRAACAVSGNVVTCEIARQALQVPGHVSIVLCVTTGKGYMLKSWPIECDCKNDRYDSTVEIQSFFYVTQISNESWTQAIQAVEELKNTIDPTLSVSGKAADAAKAGEAVGQIKEDLSDWSRLEGYELANLTPKLKLVKENVYASLEDIGKPPYYGAYDGCNVYSLDIEADIYTSTEARMILPIDENGNALAEQSNYATSFNNTELHAQKLLISLANAEEAIKTFSISKGQQLRQFDKFPEHTGIPKLENDVKKLENDVVAINAPINMHSIKKNGIFEKSGDNILLSDARTNLRKGIRLVFEANVVNGTDFEIGFSVSELNANTLPHNRFVINSTTIEYYEDIGQSEYSNSFAHKLSISQNVQVIFEYLTNGTVDICLLSNGEMFKQNIVFTMASVAIPYVKSNGLIANDCKFTFICTDIRKKIWCFGDSYFAYSTARWTYYLREHGYDNNVLLDGFPGMGSTNSRASFSKLLKLGKPKIAVWFEGMNDGTDTTDSEPNNDWKSNKDIFIALCEENSVEPVFATIPNVPTINHKGKNKWIKESGYRYIDMCHAVGADADANWYGNMLSNDKIHPSESGAKALFAQVLLDLPEVMIDNL